MRRHVNGTVFFNRINSHDYFSGRNSKIAKEVEQMTDTDILYGNMEEWKNYYFNKYCVYPIVIYENNIEEKLSKIKVRKRNPFHIHPYINEYFEEDGVRITFVIPYEGEPDLFYVQPNTYIISNFFTQNFVSPNGKNCGSFTLEFEYTNQELEEKGEKMKEFVQKEFENEYNDYKNMISYINTEVTAYNNNLPIKILQLLEQRKKKANSFSAISEALQISLRINKNAPNTTPIRLEKKMKCQPPVKPKVAPSMPEYYISDSDYNNINNIIFSCGTTMEKTARTYYANDEEELRDHLLAALNTHYESATGETFRKIGKTDIHIEFENKAAFIGECKIWHGEQLFQNAIQQVINYSTWRDLKVSVIIFNKVNKSFNTILSTINDWVVKNVKNYERRFANFWNCKYYLKEENKEVHLSILAFDIYVDKNKFKDVRYK